jgi:hypothetical protein
MTIYKKITPIFISFWLVACGGGGGGDSTPQPIPPTPTPTSSNEMLVKVAKGPQNNYVNGLLGSITVCNESGQCTTVNDVLFDTGSVGVRLLKTALPANFFQAKVDTNNKKLNNCGLFLSGHMWGEITTAKVKLGEMTTTSTIPIQIIGQSDVNTPSSCSFGNGPSIDSQASLSSNGIVGIGLFQNDCGDSCSNSPTYTYLKCDTNGCVPTAVTPSEQLKHPVAAMPAPHNNGTVISLPAISPTGAGDISGKLLFGVGTDSNNTFQNMNVIATNNFGMFPATVNGITYRNSFIDSGTNGIGLPFRNITVCSLSSSWCCPSSTLELTASMGTKTTTFNIANARQLFLTGNHAFSNLGSYFNLSSSIDFGLPFFFGKNVVIGIEGTSSNLGSGTYFAF